MAVVGIIPARMASTRFPGKPLLPILGKPMILWVLEAARSCSELDAVCVATDSQEIYDVVTEAEGLAIFTSANLASGTDRVFEAYEKMKEDAVGRGGLAKHFSEDDILVNIQGDEPLITPKEISTLVNALKENPKVGMATLAKKFTSIKDVQNPNFVKVLVNQNNEAIYFSRLPIPYSRGALPTDNFACFHHLGLYAFRAGSLKTYAQAPKCPEEEGESLEQLRALKLGIGIKLDIVDYQGLGVDVPGDLEQVIQLLEKRNANEL